MIVPQAPGRPPNLPNLGRTQVRIVWFALAALFTAAVLLALMGASTIPAGPAAGLGELFLLIATAVVVGDLAIGFFITSRMRKNAPASAPPDAVAATQVIVGSATALSGGLVCAIFFFLSRQGLLLLLALPCALVLLTWFPSEARWAALRPAGAPGAAAAPRRNPMVR
jgi:hypothetical protein